MEIREKLEDAQAEPSVVRIKRSAFETLGELAYIAVIDSNLLLLICISDEIRFNGFSVLRIEDITDVEVHDHAAFVEEALRRRGESVDEAPAVGLDDLKTAIRTAGELVPLVAIHRETVDPDICHIGKVVSVSDASVSLLEIDPDAEWEEEVSDYALSEITRVDFGCGYEDALSLVGGEAPQV